MKRILILALAGMLLCGIPAAFADKTSMLADLLAIAGADTAQAWLDGPLAQEAGVSAEWYVLALRQSGAYDLAAYRRALRDYLDGRTVRSATTRLKYAFLLLASGAPAEDAYIVAAMQDSAGRQGLMSWVWTLHLLNNGVPADIPAEEVVETILSLQLPDGGWAITGTNADPDVTAMVLQALAPHLERAEAAIDGALTRLSALQQPDGGYMSYGVANPESAGQVLLALSVLGIDGLADGRFIKDGTLLDGIAPYRLPDGRYSHTLGGPANSNATSQIFLALTAYQRFQAGQGSVFLLDEGPAGTVTMDTVTADTTASGTITTGIVTASLGYKPIAAGIIAGVALIGCAVLLLTGKRHWKNFAAVGIAAMAAIVFVLATDFQSADDYYSVTALYKQDAIGTVTLSIRCDKVAGRADFIPADGVVLAETEFPIASGDTVYTVLTEAARANRIHLERSGGPGMAYIEGLAYLYEQAYGALSGWLYRVNGETSSLACDQFTLHDGDRIEWIYTLELGSDIP